MPDEVKPVITPIMRLLKSSKFWALLISALAASGVLVGSSKEAAEAWIPIIVMVAGVVFATLTAWEDASDKR